MYPKQFQRLHSSKTLFQETVNRVIGTTFADPIIVCNEEHRFIVGEQLSEVGRRSASIILEPEGRNTAPAIAAAALWAEAQAPGAVIAVFPSDHVIGDKAAFATCLVHAAESAGEGRIVLLGVDAAEANPAYGYILPDADTQYSDVARFVEKPKREQATAMLKQGGWLWNSGIVVARSDVLLGELEKRIPDVISGVRDAFAGAVEDLDYLRLAKDPFLAVPSVSFDTAVLEPSDIVSVTRLTTSWTDASSWDALWRAGNRDKDGNVVRGTAITRKTANTLIMSEDTLVTAVGIENAAIVVTDDSILVAGREAASEIEGDIEGLIDEIAALGGEQHLFHTTIYRPWGSFHTLAAGARYQVKEIVVKPGASISLQKHFHRAEHWVVVEGTARILCGDKEFTLQENESTFIPLGEIHRLSNPGKIPVRLIEVQSGSYLGEDDIVRLEDTYGRS